MPAGDSLKRLGGGRWETRDGRFAVEPQSGTWVIVDNEQTDELGLALVRGPFGSLTAAKEAIEAARTEGPKVSPLAARLDQARTERAAPAKANGEGAPPAKPAPPKRRTAKPKPSPEPRWLRDLEPRDQRRARDLLARLARMGIDDAERIVRAEIADGEPALARLALERALAKALDGSKDSRGAVRAVVSAIVRGADVELSVGWRLVDGEGRRIEKLDVPDWSAGPTARCTRGGR